MNPTRRKLLLGALFGTGYAGLKGLATGLPPSWFLGVRSAHAADAAKPDFLILATAGSGDPMNANCPGSYVKGVQNNPDPLISQENPTITVAGNGKATQAQLQAVVANLKDYGYNATLSQTVASSSIQSTEVFDTTHDSKPITRNYLGSFYQVTVQDGSPLKSGATYEIIYVPTTAR